MAGLTQAAEITTTFNGPATIHISGEIRKGDARAFAQEYVGNAMRTTITANGVPFVEIDLDSPGGDLTEAQQIGRLARANFMYTAVRGKHLCASACVLILVAGVARVVTEDARIAIHRPRFDPSYFADMPAREATVRYNELVDGIKSYFEEMGGFKDLFARMREIPSRSIVLLSDREVDRYGIRGDDPGWRELSDAVMVRQLGEDGYRFLMDCISRPNGSKDDRFGECLQKLSKLHRSKEGE